ncbi:hypothetical protein EYF80_055707 [Liparis tanakae]|uniref:Secreted protein n=1 Tax=Liparis tanakae TaxID=230148 RepID=A0A4Z2EZE2_9TELE|nr:hypothetical protein EYF80_055707 [Liparis tanakae]
MPFHVPLIFLPCLPLVTRWTRAALIVLHPPKIYDSTGHGTVFLMQVPLSGSTSSTMTNGASSSVTMDRWSSSRVAAPPYSS